MKSHIRMTVELADRDLSLRTSYRILWPFKLALAASIVSLTTKYLSQTWKFSLGLRHCAYKLNLHLIYTRPPGPPQPPTRPFLNKTQTFYSNPVVFEL